MKYCQKAIHIIERFGGGDHLGMVMPLDMMVETYMQQGMMTEALDTVNLAIATKKEVFGKNHISLIASYLMKTIILLNQGKPKEAQEIATQNYKQSHALLGPEHKLTQTNLGLLERMGA